MTDDEQKLESHPTGQSQESKALRPPEASAGNEALPPLERAAILMELGEAHLRAGEAAQALFEIGETHAQARRAARSATIDALSSGLTSSMAMRCTKETKSGI